MNNDLSQSHRRICAAILAISIYCDMVLISLLILWIAAALHSIYAHHLSAPIVWRRIASSNDILLGLLPSAIHLMLLIKRGLGRMVCGLLMSIGSGVVISLIAVVRATKPVLPGGYADMVSVVVALLFVIPYGVVVVGSLVCVFCQCNEKNSPLNAFPVIDATEERGNGM